MKGVTGRILMRLHIFNRHAVLAGVLLAGLSSACAQSPPQPAILNPDPAVQARYIRDAKVISDLRTIILSSEHSTAKQVSAVQQLSGKYFDYALDIAQKVIDSAKPEVGLAMVSALSARISMLPSSQHAHSRSASPFDEYTARLVAKSRSALLHALDNKHASIREEAAAFLASRGDHDAAAKIQTLAEKGALPADLAISYFSLAPREVGSAYLAKYLKAGNANHRAAAISRLAYDPQYTTMVKAIALDAKEDSRVISAALPGLAASDKDFLSYGPAIASNKNMSNQVREAAVESTVKFVINQDVSPAQAREISPVLHDAARDISSPSAEKAVRSIDQRMWR